MFGWYRGGENLGRLFGLPPAAPDAAPIIGASLFWSAPFLWFYIYFAVATFAFYAFWALFSPHPWQRWSILGSALILFTTYFSVQVSVAVNAWYGPFYDMVQKALSTPGSVTAADFYWGMVEFAGIAFIAVTVSVLSLFFVSHYIFRWRTAMNNYYMSHWLRLRHIEGAAQRVQEDTMRFSSTLEQLGVSLVKSVMTLIAFLPVMLGLEKHITELPLLGKVEHPLVVAAVLWCVLGTAAVMLAGLKLPGLQFRNQRVEAAYRKELVYGEDHHERADPVTTAELFRNVRKNYFRLYGHYVYFNIVRYTYLQADNIVANTVTAPSLRSVR